VRIDKEHLKHSLKRPMTMTERLRGLVSKKNDDGVERKIDLEFAVKANDDMADFVTFACAQAARRLARARSLCTVHAHAQARGQESKGERQGEGVAGPLCQPTAWESNPKRQGVMRTRRPTRCPTNPSGDLARNQGGAQVIPDGALRVRPVACTRRRSRGT
jgi:hypothetical protein